MEDRRKRKTRESIKQAFLTLMFEKGFENITVNDIAEVADINRGTFYLHYADKYELLDTLENEMIALLSEVQSKIDIQLIKDNPIHFSDVFIKEIMQLVKEHVLFFKVMFMSGEKTSFESKFKDAIRTNFEKKLLDLPTVSGVPFNFYFAFVVNAQLGVIKEWVKTGMEEAPETVAQYAYAMASRGPLQLMYDQLNQ